jgi:hypothetical protein
LIRNQKFFELTFKKFLRNDFIGENIIFEIETKIRLRIKIRVMISGILELNNTLEVISFFLSISIVIKDIKNKIK